MAARILDDVLNNYLTVDDLKEWLSHDKAVNEKEVLLQNYECSPVQFVSYFITYLREQSSRNFQVYDAETPRKISSSRNLKSASCLSEKSSLITKSDLNSSVVANDLDLESLQSFPNLSSCSSLKSGNTEKMTSVLTPNSVIAEPGNKANSEKKITRIKLFSETVGGSPKGNTDLRKKDLDFLDEPTANFLNKFASSTPKMPFKHNIFSSSDYFISSDVAEDSCKPLNKSNKTSFSSDASSPDISLTVSKSKSLGGNSSHKNKDNKINSRMSLGDFILNDVNNSDCKKEKKNKIKKRINPVRLSNAGWHQEKQENVLEAGAEENCTSIFSLETEQSHASGSEKTNLSEEKIFNEKTSDELTKRELPSHINELKILSKIYSCLISENYCQNIMIELCFIVSLLVIQDSDKKRSELNFNGNERKIFESIDNCVYFAVEMLWLQRSCLLHLNLSALKLLSENARIEKFNKDLKEFLLSAYTQSQSSEEFKRHQSFIKTGVQGNVSFQYETDNRENFTSDVSFHSFKKQRDLFYNILAIWEANHLVSGWIFSVGLGSKIRSLLTISSDPINLLHLARLFRNQLITSCCGESQTEGDLNEKILQLLPSADPNKILRLRARLTSSPKRQGPCPLPDFTGHQEFYKDFIIYTSNSVFHEHLKNSLCDEILRLNDTDLIGDAEDEESSVDELTEERYFQCVNILRVLAKFLGFLEFMPYRGEKLFSERISNIHCSVRNHILPLFDITSCLQSAMKKGKLILTVPWVVSYLSMIDPYSARLKTYQSVWRLLIFIYKWLKALKNERNRFYLKLTLGWIFQLPSFPPDQFYNVLEECKKTSSENFQPLFLTDVEKAETRLDSRDFIEGSVLYAVCPFLNEINVILSENSGCSVRHIRPVTTRETSFTKFQASKQLQLRLESNFLHNQSSSTRKTVEFVTERVASVSIKHLIYKTIPKVKEKFWADLDKFSTLDSEKEVEVAAERLSQTCYEELLSVCRAENQKLSLERSEVATKALLSNDLQSSVAETCTKIAARQAMEKVDRWIQSHLTLAMINKEFASGMRKKKTRVIDPDLIKNSSLTSCCHLPSREKDIGACESAWPASQMIKTVKESICRVREGYVTQDSLQLLMEETMKTVRNRSDMIPATEKALLSLILDLVTMFCIHSKAFDSSKFIEKFILLLRSVKSEARCNLERIICSRNMAVIYNESKSRDDSCENLGKLLFLLLEENFIEKENLEAQLLSLFRHPYEKEEGEIYVKLISVLFDRYTKIYGFDKFSLLLEYLMETINDEESKAEDFT